MTHAAPATRLPRSQRVAATVAACAPVVTTIVFSIVFWRHLPARMPVHWSLNGTPDGFGTPTNTILTLAVIQALFLTAAIGSAHAVDAHKARIACAVTSAFVGLLATSWIAIALAASQNNSPTWWLVIVGSLWGAIPYLILRNTYRNHPSSRASHHTVS